MIFYKARSKNKTNWIGVYQIDQIYEPTGRVLATTKHNVVVQNFYTSVFKFLNQDTDAPASTILNLTHLAIGDGTTAAARTDTALVNETFRKALTTKSYNTTTFTAKLSIAASEGNPTGGYIKEVGIYAAATDTAVSGTLISRATVNITKNSNIKLLITWTLTGA